MFFLFFLFSLSLIPLSHSPLLSYPLTSLPHDLSTQANDTHNQQPTIITTINKQRKAKPQALPSYLSIILYHNNNCYCSSMPLPSQCPRYPYRTKAPCPCTYNVPCYNKPHDLYHSIIPSRCPNRHGFHCHSLTP